LCDIGAEFTFGLIAIKDVACDLQMAYLILPQGYRLFTQNGGICPVLLSQVAIFVI
jgi:hypothetical protein